MAPRAPIIALKDVRLADGPRMLFDGVDLALEAVNSSGVNGRQLKTTVEDNACNPTEGANSTSKLVALDPKPVAIVGLFCSSATEGLCGAVRGCIPARWARRPPFIRLQPAHAATTLSQVVRPPRWRPAPEGATVITLLAAQYPRQSVTRIRACLPRSSRSRSRW